MLNTKIRAGWNRLMAPIGRSVARLGISPDAVTLLGVAVHVPVALLILDGRLLAAGVVAIAAALMDAVDGAVARARGVTSRFGALLDSTTDRLTEALFLLPIAWLYGVAPDIAGRDEPWVAAMAATALVTSFSVSYVKARAESLGYECNVGFAERAERMIVLIAALILDILPLGLTVLVILTGVTFLQRLLHVRAQAVAS